ncbi:bifunctional phosphopantothenoylcysteine decarboxylase/phosphopantothenate--cysteine ligase CoaBC [Thiomicrospira sp. ALE5]|uniref:bifunctional phosphopantothenoylcysteine decarboxylase/phosphopantothenate--cysteine ligase CoaBC n=1 Tax=Thiomicrospira sp. ALE5 TaxID=748650 RepID=UPI0008E78BD3|nr:bifunctional phosphopantothenoylcysteine decarboxylase/phosphopantothenate--cysteine ligase CoaBC [Thiomicrospira sp. ALE5]SFR62522.1 phosphopantothenoylcysteine decarboxylase / phosphopantothenate--cysteine ligase [Thiomicrospira sp. ALE5]
MKILLGVSGGIAAYKALQLVRLLVKAGHQVQVVMTEGAKQFVQPLSFQALSGRPVRDSLFDLAQENGMGHIELARWPDLIVLAPVSANLLARLRVGMADDLLTTLCLASDRPILFAPAMNQLMWANSATQDNVAALMARGWQLIAPGEGEQACGDVGAGRLAEPDDIARAVAAYHSASAIAETSHQQAWLGKKLLITAGPTFEDLDPVRFIGNRSSGQMGFAIAAAAAQQGAEVTLIAGPVNLDTPTGVTRINVRSAMQMFSQVQAHYASVDVMIGAAAVADYRLAQPSSHKIKKQPNQDELTLTLIKNPDIIAWVAQQVDKPYVVGFAAETQQLVDYARQKRLQKGLDMICANQVGDGQGFEVDENALLVMTATDEVALPKQAKYSLAVALLAQLRKQLDITKG